MYVFSGGGYGGSADDDGLTNGCSTHRHLQDPARRGAGAALPDPLRAVRPARALGRRRPHARRLRRRLQGARPARRGAALVPHGSRPLRAARPLRRQGRRPQRRGRRAARERRIARRTGRRTRTFASSPATRSTCGRRAAAATAIPLTRDPGLVRRDVVRGYLTAEDAERDYAVVLTGEPPQVDQAATARVRRERRA